MSSTKGRPGPLAEKRIITDIGNMQPIWKLYGNGSVGSQTLGIPHLTALRDDPELASISKVWPLETGMRMLPNRENPDMANSPRRDLPVVFARAAFVSGG
jgi:precorrin-8X/cobalt-precorrin-8 methylmutase